MLSRVDYKCVSLRTCPNCKGEWDDWNRQRAIERKREVDVSAPQAHAGAAQAEAPRKEVNPICPKCITWMEKFRYRKGTDIIINQCRKWNGCRLTFSFRVGRCR